MIVVLLTIQVFVHPVPNHWQGNVFLKLLKLGALNSQMARVRKGVDRELILAKRLNNKPGLCLQWSLKKGRVQWCRGDFNVVINKWSTKGLLGGQGSVWGSQEVGSFQWLQSRGEACEPGTESSEYWSKRMGSYFRRYKNPPDDDNLKELARSCKKSPPPPQPLGRAPGPPLWCGNSRTVLRYL